MDKGEKVLSKAQQMHYKETEPELTVKKLRKILNDEGIEVEESWMDKSSVDTFSLRLVIKGTQIGTNGKGVTREFACASAYGEFFERFQNKALGSFYFLEEEEFYITKDEKIQTAKELVENETSFMKYYFKELFMDEASTEDKIKHLNSVEIRDKMEYGLNEAYITLPFFNVNKKKVEYLSPSIYRPWYSSNGMCAGNSKEEALIQGLAEIVERLVQKKLFLEKPRLPDIPEWYIEKFPDIYERFLMMKEIEGYDFYFKDCSLGGQYPVAALVCIEKDTGRYGMKLGCHPDYGIAMERTITEITQGQDITDFCDKSKLDFNNIQVENERNIINSFKAGLAQYPYQLLGVNPVYDFVEMPDVSGNSNREILNDFLDDFIEKGYEVYIRDESLLDVPSFHIIIPGISELISPNLNMIKAFNTKLYLKPYIEHPKRMKKEICKYVVSSLSYFKGMLLEDSMASFYSDGFDCSVIPAENIDASADYMLAVCYGWLCSYKKAADAVNKVLRKAELYHVSEQEVAYYRALHHYFTAMYYLSSHIQVMEYLKIYFSSEICDKIDYLFCKPDQTVIKQYLSVDEMPRRYYVKEDNNIKNAYKLYQKICNLTVKQEEIGNLIK